MGLSGLLFGDSPAVFAANFPLEESVRRLSSAVEPFRAFSGLRAHEGRRVFGSVDQRRVWLVWVTPFISNIFRPRFVGHFETRGDQAVLVGKFAVVPVAKLWACMIAAMGVLFMVVVGMQARMHGPPVLAFGLPVACVISVAGFAVIRLSQWLTRSLRRNLASFITASLGPET
jgi:hypothetical protein